MNNHTAKTSALQSATADWYAEVNTVWSAIADHSAEVNTVWSATTDHSAEVNTVQSATADRSAEVNTVQSATADHSAEVNTVWSATADRSAASFLPLYDPERGRMIIAEYSSINMRPPFGVEHRSIQTPLFTKFIQTLFCFNYITLKL
jgi:hypothetical protein